ncbi:MAG TPA: GrpB family protein, partial [Chromatiales bacterium]|nr:GrpB family protein [Chromatiales bacterium]
LFSDEASRIQDVAGDHLLSIHHVGSTAVPLAGKPVVDLLVGVRSLQEAKEQLVPRLTTLGYEDFGEVFIKGRVYLRRRGPPDFNVAVTRIDGPFYWTQLTVRDYLRAHPHQALAYEEEKRKVYDGGAQRFSTYSQQKAKFLEDLISQARRWAEEELRVPPGAFG